MNSRNKNDQRKPEWRTDRERCLNERSGKESPNELYERPKMSEWMTDRIKIWKCEWMTDRKAWKSKWKTDRKKVEWMIKESLNKGPKD